MVRDIEALGDVYDLHAAVVYGVALKVTDDRGAAEEVTRAVFRELWCRPDRFDPDQGSLRPWLACSAHQLGVQALREMASIHCRDEQGASYDVRIIDIDEVIQSVLNVELVSDALAAVPEDERIVIRLAYFGGKTYQEVAVDLGIAEETVKSRMYAGLRRMADSLHGKVLAPETKRGP
jgi:RNA polymerase sigma-70 factor (ECF subfamily)